jgi:uncharacterized protein (DUF1697 family)
MAKVVLLRGVNVGGHRTFRPSALVHTLAPLEVVNIGAAGTFVVRGRPSRAAVRAAFAAKIPFDADMAICDGRAVLELIASNPFADEPDAAECTKFVSVATTRSAAALALPMRLPERGGWLLKVIAQDGPFVCGVYRRQMQALRHLAALDKRLGVPMTTRNWNTMQAIAKVLGGTGD